MNLSTADGRNYRTEFHETGWSYRYMFLVGPKEKKEKKEEKEKNNNNKKRSKNNKSQNVVWET
jgi:hypothetical protein